MDTDFAAAFAASEAAGFLVTIIAFVLHILIICVSFGTLTRKLARHKGYTGYFWRGFFLTIIGLIYVVGLPDRSQAAPQRSDES